MTTTTNTPFISVTKGGSTPILIEGTIQEETKKAGSKYDRDLDIKDIAKLVRKELATEYPIKEGWKFSVKIDRYAGGQSMDVSIISIPENVYAYDAEAYDIHFQIMNGEGGAWDAMKLTDNFKKILDDVKAIQDQYNYDNSDTMTDYFDVNFYGHVALDGDIINFYKSAFGLLYGEFKF